VRIENRGEKTVVVKDYSTRGFFVRLYGRFTLKREAAVYRCLAGLAGVPCCYGFDGNHSLVIEYIPCRKLREIGRGNVTEAVFDRLDALVLNIHSRGVAIVDLHGSNVLVGGPDDVYIIDFAHALIARNSRRPGRVARFFMQLDTHAARRIRARYLRQEMPAPAGVLGLLYGAGKGLKSVLKKLRYG